MSDPLGIELAHPDGTRITIYLPAPVSSVAAAMTALGGVGFELVRDEEKVHSR